MKQYDPNITFRASTEMVRQMDLISRDNNKPRSVFIRDAIEAAILKDSKRKT